MMALSHWHNEMKQKVRSIMEELLLFRTKINDSIWTIKNFLPMSHLPLPYQIKIMITLLKVINQYEQMLRLTLRSSRSLSTNNVQQLGALIQLERPTTLFSKLLSSPALQELALLSQSQPNLAPYGQHLKMIGSLLHSCNTQEAAIIGNVLILPKPLPTSESSNGTNQSNQEDQSTN
jgi:hypothetical protein